MFEADRTDGILCYVSFFSFFLLQLSAFGRSTNAVGRLEEDHMTQATGRQRSSASGLQDFYRREGKGAIREQFGSNSGCGGRISVGFCERIARRVWLWPCH